jgi:hypothetical protein
MLSQRLKHLEEVEYVSSSEKELPASQPLPNLAPAAGERGLRGLDQEGVCEVQRPMQHSTNYHR